MVFLWFFFFIFANIFLLPINILQKFYLVHRAVINNRLDAVSFSHLSVTLSSEKCWVSPAAVLTCSHSESENLLPDLIKKFYFSCVYGLCSILVNICVHFLGKLSIIFLPDWYLIKNTATSKFPGFSALRIWNVCVCLCVSVYLCVFSLHKFAALFPSHSSFILLLSFL